MLLFYIGFNFCGGCSRRWKGENVATSEVADVLTMARCVLEANVYGVKVEGEAREPEPKARRSAPLTHPLAAISQARKGGSAWQLLS